MIVIFGYLAYQMNGISVTLSAVLEQNSSLYETKTRGNLGLLQVEENSNNNGTNENSISEQLVLSNVSSATSSESPESGTDAGGQNAERWNIPLRCNT